jgi:hypothetical protein
VDDFVNGPGELRGEVPGAEDFPNKGRAPFVSYMKTKAQSFMRLSVVILVMLACALAGRASAGQGATTFYVQLVCGSAPADESLLDLLLHRLADALFRLGCLY